MIIFHEGMPRSGKSYAATVDHIVPALKSGRKVYARIDGINHDQFAELAEITPERCRELLIELTEEQVHKLHQVEIENDSLVVIDELQNYWPQAKPPLSPEMTKWIAEHGHHGLDVVNMGQLLKDCHRTWVNRTNRKIQFVKKDMLGKPNEYKWTMYTGSPDARGQVKFVEVQKGDAKYDEKYFGCYKSHSQGTDNKGTYVDDRANIWKSPIFRKWLPLFGVVVLASIGYIVYLFRGGIAPPPKAAVPVTTTTKVVTLQKPGQPPVEIYNSEHPQEANTNVLQSLNEPKPAADTQKPKEPAKATEKTKSDDFDFPDVVTELSKDNRIRLAMVMHTSKATKVVIEWRDAGGRVIEQMGNADLQALGYQVMVSASDRMALVVGPGGRKIATAWPIEDQVAKVPEATIDQMRRDGKQFAPNVTQSHPVAPVAWEEPKLPPTGPIHTTDAVPMYKTKWKF